jgi:hypothetical protein
VADDYITLYLGTRYSQCVRGTKLELCTAQQLDRRVVANITSIRNKSKHTEIVLRSLDSAACRFVGTFRYRMDDALYATAKVEPLVTLTSQTPWQTLVDLQVHHVVPWQRTYLLAYQAEHKIPRGLT